MSGRKAQLGCHSAVWDGSRTVLEESWGWIHTVAAEDKRWDGLIIMDLGRALERFNPASRKASEVSRFSAVHVKVEKLQNSDLFAT